MRLPWTIWLHVLAEMWRLMLLTAAILTVVTAFAATVRFTASGRLGPVDTLKFMTLAMVPMLQYVLPFAAGFGATLAYHRATQENELTAAKAGGVSHRALLIPALLTGLVMGAALSGLNGWVIPKFLRSMEKLIAKDAARLLMRQVDTGRALDLGRRLIYADKCYRVTPDEPVRGGPYEVLLLTGVVALDLGPKGEIVGEAMASQATVGFFTSEQGDRAHGSGELTTVSLDLKNAVARGKLERIQAGSQTLTFPILGSFHDDPKYYSNRDMAAIPADPDQINWVDLSRRELASRIAERRMIANIEASLAAQQRVRMTNVAGQTFSIRATGLTRVEPRWELSPIGGAIEVDLYSLGPGGQPDPSGLVRLTSKKGGFKGEAGSDPATRRVTLELELEQVSSQTTSATGGPAATGQRADLSYGGLAPLDNPLPSLLQKTSAELLKEAAAATAGRPDPFIDEPAAELARRIRSLTNDVLAKLHERGAMALACLVMVLTGALTAMRLATSLPLAVYLWSFFPALVCVLTVSAGANVTRHLGAPGLVMLWGGVVAMAGYTLGAFWLVRRH